MKNWPQTWNCASRRRRERRGGVLRVKILLAALLPLLVACGREPADRVATEADEEHGDSIAWHPGEVEAAFELAKQEGKPVFLYWGAEWCPPCHYLKSKIFKRPEFVARSREFVAVYLDGDTESAQILGEELGVKGYPTVIIFSPQGEEIMRMPNGIPVERYAQVLDMALERMRPVHEVLAEVIAADASEVRSEDLQLLAFYSWGQDNKLVPPPEERLATFKTLHRKTPPELTVERSRFLAMLLEEAAAWEGRADEDVASQQSALSPDEKAAYTEEVADLLENPELRGLNLSFVFFAAPETVGLLFPEPSPAREVLMQRWEGAAQAVEQDETLSVDDRITALLPQIWLAQLRARNGVPATAESEPELPAELVGRVRQQVAWAGKTVQDESELQTVMSTMASLLVQVGLDAEAEALLTDRMGDAVAPYYFMSWVAGMKQQADQPQEALAWYRKAYDSSRGRYSRFRWGSTYLRRLMDLAPEDEATIESDSIEILGELLSFDDAFAGGNYSRLSDLESAYESWNGGGGHEQPLARIRELVHQACDRYPAGDEESQQTRCQAFLG